MVSQRRGTAQERRVMISVAGSIAMIILSVAGSWLWRAFPTLWGGR
jgi:hypothetical protein